ncbi:uncharacterized protein TNCV_1042931 [Trichonephila clavipes]|nr:uncharacterized protein TNCV_1042931 [Trichonephila clavipes]
MTPTHRCIRLEWCRALRNWTATRSRDECLNRTFTLQRSTGPTAGLMVWSTIANGTRLPAMFFLDTIQRYVHDNLQPHLLPLMTELSGVIFQRTPTHIKDATRLPPPHYHPSLACLISRFVSNGAFRGSFGVSNSTAYEFGRIRGAFTTNVQRHFPEYHTEIVLILARSYRIVHLRLRDYNRVLKCSFICTFFCNEWSFYFDFLMLLISK